MLWLTPEQLDIYGGDVTKWIFRIERMNRAIPPQGLMLPTEVRQLLVPLVQCPLSPPLATRPPSVKDVMTKLLRHLSIHPAVFNLDLLIV